MDNQNNPLDNQSPSTVEQPVAAPATETPQPALKKQHSWSKIATISAVVLLFLAMVSLAYFLGTKSASSEKNSNISADTSSTADVAQEEAIEETVTPEIEEYSGWNTYKNSTYDYSFKYPASWQVDRDIVQDSADWVSINPASEANADGDVLAIYTYFDGTGCPNTKTKDFTIGGYAVKGTACEGTDVYKVNMKYSKQVSVRSGANATLVVAAPNLVGVQIDTSSGENEAVQQILDSITGLTPANN